MNRGKASASPPIQLTGTVPSRNISQYSVPPRGQTPPYREEYPASGYIGQSYVSTTLQPTYLHGVIQPNLPHDINKASAVSQQSQRLPLSGATPQTMYTQGPRPQNPQSMPGAGYYGQQTPARMARPPMTPMGMHQPQMTYQMYMPQGPGYPGAQTQIHMVPQNPTYPTYCAPPQANHRMPANLSHYPVSSGQTNQQYAMGPNTQFYNAPSNSTTPVYFSPGQNMPIAQPQRPSSASSVHSQEPRQKWEKRLKIVDPNTGKDIMEGIVGATTRQTPPQSGTSSARATPVSPSSTPSPPQQNVIAAQFAAQVAASLKPATSRHQPPPHMQQMPPQMGIPIPHPQGPPPEGMTPVQMPPKVGSPGQFQRTAMTPPGPHMMGPPPPQLAHAGVPVVTAGATPPYVVHPGQPTQHQPFKPTIQTQPQPLPQHIPQPQPDSQAPAPQSQEPPKPTAIPSHPVQPATVSVPVVDEVVPEEPVPQRTVEVAVPSAVSEPVAEVKAPSVDSTEEISVHATETPTQSEESKLTPREEVSLPIETPKVEKVVVELRKEPEMDSEEKEDVAEKTDSVDQDSKPAVVIKEAVKLPVSVSSNQGDVATPTLAKTEATPSAIVSEKSEVRTIPQSTSAPSDSVKTITAPRVTAEVKLPVTQPEVSEVSAVGTADKQTRDTTVVPTEKMEEVDNSVKVTPAPEVTPADSREEAPLEVKAVAKPKHKVRGKELNAKGETKQGSDMDLFLDSSAKKADVEVTTESTVEVEPAVEPVKETVSVTTPETPPSDPIMTSEEEKEVKMEKVEIQMDNRVVEENEKNDVKSNEKNNEQNSTPTAPKRPELKYQYKVDQWSPLNPEGKKHYDRAFLLTLQYCTESVAKPEGLPNLPEVILDKPHSKENTRSFDPSFQPPRGGGGGGGGGGGFDFTPGFVRPSPRGGSSSMGGGGGKNRSQQGRKEIPKKIITTVSIQQDIKLHNAEKAWKPQQKQKKNDQNAPESVTEKLFRQVTSILNKLTPQKFNTLVQQMTELTIDTEERLKGVIDLIFEKAVSEPGFCVAYANMCKYLMKLRVPLEDKPGEFVDFRKLLLNQCQREFEKDNRQEIEYNARMEEIQKAEESLRPQMLEDLEISSTKARRRSLGNIRFIGELFKLKMLTENIMHHCVLKLLKSHDEESLECLCRLLSTIGKELDSDEAKPRVDQYFKQMTKIVAQRKTSSRVRFMIQDVIDLRLNRWVPRRDENAPKTIDQIHKEVAQEAQEKAALNQQHMNTMPQQRGGRGSRGDRDRGGRPQGQPNVGEDGWSTVGVRAARATIDPSKLKLSKPQHVDENIQLGPGSRFSSWGRGSSAGGTKSQESERPNAPGNRFSALSSRGDDSHDHRNRGRGRGISPARTDIRARTSSSRDPPRSKQGPRSSMEMERQSALETAKSLTSGRSNPPSREPSREDSRSRDSRREVKPPPPADLTDDEIEKKTKAIMDEYLHIQDSKEAELCIEELRTPKNLYRFVSTSLNHVIERSEVARRQTGHLLHDAVKKKLIPIDCYVKGLNEVLEFAEDMEIDIPRIWAYLGELISPMVRDGCVPLSTLKSVCDPLKANNKAGELVSNVLHEAARNLGHLQVADLWKASGLQWSDFLPESVDINQFIKDKKLEWTVADQPPKSPGLSPEEIHAQLHDLLVQKNADNEVIFDWIEANVDEAARSSRFIRTLMSLVCTSAIQGTTPSCKVDEAVISKRGVLLQKYLDHQAELELQALYSLQALANKLEYPQGLLRRFFEILYDEDIISEDAFCHWEKSKDPAEQEGKGVALKQVVQFFTWLQETEGETQES